MPQAPSYVEIYDFESALEEAVKSILTAAGFTVIVTRLNAVEDNSASQTQQPDSDSFQRVRPRIEVRANLGPPLPLAHQRLIPQLREKHIDIFRFQLGLQVVTEPATTTVNDQHPRYRARVRREMAAIEKRINTDELLPYHTVARCWAAGTQPTQQSENGLEFSVLQYEGDIGVRPEAWPDES